MNLLELLQLPFSLLKPKVVPLPDMKSVTSDVIESAPLPFGGNKVWFVEPQYDRIFEPTTEKV